jgi:hypothetical protein
MNALVHFCSALAGAAGAFVTALVMSPRLGITYRFISTPICFCLAAISWFFLKLDFNRLESAGVDQTRTWNPFRAVLRSVLLFMESAFSGAKIVLTHRKYIWLLPCYSLSLFGHQYLENGITPVIAQRYLGNAEWSLIMIGGSNIGQLLGGIFVFIFAGAIPTPLPWLRLEGLISAFLWYLKWWYPSHTMAQAWVAAASFVPISFGWAAGDISLSAYIQASASRIKSTNNIPTLGAVMAFLYCFHLGTYAAASTLLGRIMDDKSNAGDTREGIGLLCCVQLTVIFSLSWYGTFIPKGSISWNPKMLFNERLDLDEEEHTHELIEG